MRASERGHHAPTATLVSAARAARSVCNYAAFVQPEHITRTPEGVEEPLYRMAQRTRTALDAALEPFKTPADGQTLTVNAHPPTGLTAAYLQPITAELDTEQEQS